MRAIIPQAGPQYECGPTPLPRRVIGRSVPRIDQAYACRLEMSSITCGKNGSSGSGDTGNLHIADLHCLASTLASRCNGSSGKSRR